MERVYSCNPGARMGLQIKGLETSDDLSPSRVLFHITTQQVWYGTVGFNVPLDTILVISETGGPEQ